MNGEWHFTIVDNSDGVEERGNQICGSFKYHINFYLNTYMREGNKFVTYLCSHTDIS